MVTWTLLADYHGLHIAAPHVQAEPVGWEQSRPRANRIRVREHTCSCQRLIFELCTSGGLWFVRRISGEGPSEAVESAWLSARDARDLWVQILTGQAQ
ncbi:hypothetical protein [Nonomuraea sp. NPDC049158]|uniref:hypothetical protein n=1 Tax=Nonomuraea sp. NPDC049158 TaxID=3155649 RepID=UPI0033DD343B